jgi:hypothetical protein
LFVKIVKRVCQIKQDDSMFGWDDILKRIRQKPFRPFRIIASEGQRFDIYHPDLVLVGHRDLAIGHPGPDNPAVYDGLTQVALVHVVALENLPEQTPSPSNGSANDHP